MMDLRPAKPGIWLLGNAPHGGAQSERLLKTTRVRACSGIPECDQSADRGHSLRRNSPCEERIGNPSPDTSKISLAVSDLQGSLEQAVPNPPPSLRASNGARNSVETNARKPSAIASPHCWGRASHASHQVRPNVRPALWELTFSPGFLSCGQTPPRSFQGLAANRTRPQVFVIATFCMAELCIFCSTGRSSGSPRATLKVVFQ